MNKTKNYDKNFKDFQLLYLKKLYSQLQNLSSMADACGSGIISRAQIEDLKQSVHKLAGSGATFGFPEISEQAFQIEALIDKYMREESSSSQSDLDRIKTLLERFIEIAETIKLPEKTRKKTERKEEYIDPSLSSTPSSNHILVADDDEILQSFLSKALIEKGYRCTCVKNGLEVLSFLKQNLPDLIILDNNMPELNGVRTLEIIKKDEKLKSIPVIMLTRNVDDETIIKSMISGVHDYLTKPFEVDELTRTVETILRHQTTTILVADDDEIICDLLKKRFYRMGYSVLIAENGLKAWESVKLLKPDLCVLDITIPGMNGTSILRAIRQTPEIAQTPVIILSAKNQTANILEHLESGANDYITKPFDLDILSTKVSKILDHKKSV